MGLRFDQLPQGITTTGADIVAVMQQGVTRQKTIASLNDPITLGNVAFTGATWTLSANITATRALGVANAGTTVAWERATTLSGDPGGTTDVRANLFDTVLTGAVSVTNLENMSPRIEVRHSSGTLSIGKTMLGYARLGLASSTVGNVTQLGCLDFHIAHEGVVGAINTAIVYRANDVDLLDGNGTIGSLYAFDSGDEGHATRITSETVNFNARDNTGGAPMTANFRAANSAGAGKWCFFALGTADNFFEGKIKFGATGIAANNAQTVTTGNVGPGSSSISIQEWASVKNASGATRYIALYG